MIERSKVRVCLRVSSQKFAAIVDTDIVGRKENEEKTLKRAFCSTKSKKKVLGLTRELATSKRRIGVPQRLVGVLRIPEDLRVLAPSEPILPHATLPRAFHSGKLAVVWGLRVCKPAKGCALPTLTLSVTRVRRVVIGLHRKAREPEATGRCDLVWGGGHQATKSRAVGRSVFVGKSL